MLGLSSCSTLLLSLPSPSNHPAGLLFHYSVVSHLLQKTHTQDQCWDFHPALHFCSHCHHHLTILQGYYSTTLSCLISYRKHILCTSAGSFILLYTFTLIAITIFLSLSLIFCSTFLPRLYRPGLSHCWKFWDVPLWYHFKMTDFSTLVTFMTPCRTSIPCRMIILATVCHLSHSMQCQWHYWPVLN